MSAFNEHKKIPAKIVAMATGATTEAIADAGEGAVGASTGSKRKCSYEPVLLQAVVPVTRCPTTRHPGGTTSAVLAVALKAGDPCVRAAPSINLQAQGHKIWHDERLMYGTPQKESQRQR